MDYVTTDDQKICKNCKYWKFYQENGWTNNKWNECEKVEWLDLKDNLDENQMSVYASSSDDTGLMAGLRTGPLFGCTLFVKKEV